MKRVLLMASLIGLFMVTSMDLQAYHRRNGLPQHRRGGFAFTLHRHFPLVIHPSRYGQYRYGNERRMAREIAKNEKRIWKLEKKIYKLERRGGSYERIRELEQEIDGLRWRNDYLRNRLY
jgi:hypothetical protein